MSRRTQVQKQLKADSWSPLIQRNLPLVKYVLSKVARNLPPSVDRDDLIAAGQMGLVEAARRFDPRRNVPFHSYAIPRIWGAMLDELRSYDWFSSGVRDQISHLQEGRRRLQQMGRPIPSIADLAEETGYSEQKVERLLALAKLGHRSASTEFGGSDAEENRLYGRTGTRPPRDPYEEADFHDQKRVLAGAISDLPEREKQVIILRYDQELFLHEIGGILGVSESRVCQIHAQALRRLRRGLKRCGLEEK